MADRIFFVPGQRPKPQPDVHRDQLWRCLVRGVRNSDDATGAALADCADLFRLVSWNHSYYGEFDDITPDLPCIDRACEKRVADERDIRQAKSWRTRLAWLLYHLVDRMHFVIDLIPDPDLRSVLEESDRYFSNQHGVGESVRQVLKDALIESFDNRDRVLLIGHSLGSVIAYDTLWELSHVDRCEGVIDRFVTLGSPLGVNYVRKHLLGRHEAPSLRYPTNIRRWTNVAAVGELRALDRVVANDFGDMVTKGIVEEIVDHTDDVYTWFRGEKGLNVHRSYGYLVNPVVGRVIGEWWNDAGDTRGEGQ